MNVLTEKWKDWQVKTRAEHWIHGSSVQSEESLVIVLSSEDRETDDMISLPGAQFQQQGGKSSFFLPRPLVWITLRKRKMVLWVPATLLRGRLLHVHLQPCYSSLTLIPVQNFLDISSIKASLFQVPVPWGKTLIAHSLLLRAMYWHFVGGLWRLVTYATYFWHHGKQYSGSFLRVGGSVSGHHWRTVRRHPCWAFHK